MLYSKQIILEQIEILNNYKISKTYFDYTIGDFYLKDYSKKSILIKDMNDFQLTLKSVFSYNQYLDCKTLLSDFSVYYDKVILKKFLILDSNYQILNIQNNKYYKFKIYYKTHKSKKSFLKNIIEEFKIEYGLH